MNKAGFIIKIILFISIALIIYGIWNIYNTRGYEKTNGYFVETESSYDNSGHYNGERLIYKYNVNGIEYKCKTDYSTNVIPKIGTEKTIKYNKDNPTEAVVGEFGGNIIPVFVGAIFLLAIVFFFSLLLHPTLAKYLLGTIFIIFGSFSYYLLVRDLGNYSIINAIKEIGLFVIIPIVLILAGVVDIISNIVKSLKKEEIGK